MSADEPDTLAAARAEVERTREELGNTVEALAYKADVKARAHDKVDEVKAHAAEKVHEVKAQAVDAAEQVKAKAEATVGQVKAKAEETAAEVKARAEDTAGEAKAKAEGDAGPVKRSAGQAVARVRQLPPAKLAGVAVAGLVLLVLVRRRRR
ncbi:MAG: hypothetical protein QOD69_3335 [Solirubrobacteraceae bacterium]|nr:hypothetical protein [Solirubrobacteraceae bacterium]